MLNNVYEMSLFYIKLLPTYLVILVVSFLVGVIGIFIKLYSIRIDRKAEEYRNEVLLKKSWYRRFIIYFHGEKALEKKPVLFSPINHNPRKAQIQYKDKVFFYKVKNNEIKVLIALIEANGNIVSSEEIVKILDMPLSYQVGTPLKDYMKYLYETVSRLRKLLKDKFNISEVEISELIITVKDNGYRIGNTINNNLSR